MALSSSWFVLMISIYFVEVYIIQRKISEASVVVSNENELQVNADNSKHMFMFGNEDVGQNNI
jgi:hypothetical protein